MSSSAKVSLGPAGPIKNFQELLDLSLAAIDLQRRRVERAAEIEAAEGGLKPDVSVELKRLTHMVVAHNILVSSSQAKTPIPTEEGPNFMEKLLAKLDDQEQKKRRPRKAPQQASRTQVNTSNYEASTHAKYEAAKQSSV